MNVGQILETHLGWAANVLGLEFRHPVFDGAAESEIRSSSMGPAKLNSSGYPEMINRSGKDQPLRWNDW